MTRKPSYEELERRVEHLEKQLQQTQHPESIVTLAADVAQDLNLILAAITGYTALALFEIPRNTRLRSNIEEILRSGKRGRDLVCKILELSRWRNPGKQPVPSEVRPGHTQRESAEDREPEYACAHWVPT